MRVITVLERFAVEHSQHHGSSQDRNEPDQRELHGSLLRLEADVASDSPSGQHLKDDGQQCEGRNDDGKKIDIHGGFQSRHDCSDGKCSVLVCMSAGRTKGFTVPWAG